MCLVAAVAAVLACAAPAVSDEVAPTEPTSAPTPEPTDPTPEPTRGPQTPLLVIGDSISGSARYSLTGGGGKHKVWWAWVAQAAGVEPIDVARSTESGSGLLARGVGGGFLCYGTTFGERLADVEQSNPQVIIVAGGRNDLRYCRGSRLLPTTEAQRRAAAVSYFGRLAESADRLDLPRSRVYVMTPWGARDETGHSAITLLFESLAHEYGFTWVSLPALQRADTMDGVHPNARGSQLIASWVLAASDIASTIRHAGTTPGTVPSGASIRCSGAAACRTAGFAAARYSSATRSIWSARAKTDRHYVAWRLTSRSAPAVPLLKATTAASWYDVALRSRAATAHALPRVGDVAWWPTAPASTGLESSAGHVGIVAKVARNNGWVVVTEVDGAGRYRATRYSGASLPRAYLRFGRTSGTPRGWVRTVTAAPRSVTVSGRVSDPDAPRARVRVRITVTQAGRVRSDTVARVPFDFTRSVRVRALRTGRATVTVRALNSPGSRGGSPVIARRVITVP